MKKIYTLLFCSVVAVAAHSQCQPDPNAFGGPGNTNYSIIPDTVTNLPPAYVSVGYTTDLQFHIKPDTVTQFGTVPITQVQIDSVVGLPAGFIYTPNPTNGTFTTTSATPPGTGYGCVRVTGTAVAGQETGGPNSDGVYPLTVYYTGTAVVFNQPVPTQSTINGYRIVIMPFNGIAVNSISAFGVSMIAPNPANTQTVFTLDSPVTGSTDFTIYNCIGSVVKHESINLNRGENNYTLNTSSLSEGVYMCSFRMGTSVITRRITVAH